LLSLSAFSEGRNGAQPNLTKETGYIDALFLLSAPTLIDSGETLSLLLLLLVPSLHGLAFYLRSILSFLKPCFVMVLDLVSAAIFGPSETKIIFWRFLETISELLFFLGF